MEEVRDFDPLVGEAEHVYQEDILLRSFMKHNFPFLFYKTAN